MVDWLSVMMMGPWHAIRCEVDDVFKWDVPNVRPGLAVYCASDTRHFAKRFIVTDQAGTKLVTIQAQPKDHKKFPQDFCTAQFSNETLASGEWRELLRALVYMGCEHMGVERVDIAADGWEDERLGGGGDYIPVVQAALAGYGDYFGKAHWKTHHMGRGFKGFNGFEFGSRAGNKFMRCYRKKREMKAKGHKPHVVEAWRAALGEGIDPMKDPREVGRLEIQMKGKELRRYFAGESDWQLLADLHTPATRVQVFDSTTETMFDFRGHPRDGRARTAIPLHVWDWSLCTTNPRRNLARQQRARTISPHRVKSALHFLYDLYLTTADQDLLKAAERAAAAAGSQFVDYLRSKELQWEALHAAIARENKMLTGDPFTRSFMQRLAAGAGDDAPRYVEEFDAGGDAYSRYVEWEPVREKLSNEPPPPPEEPDEHDLFGPSRKRR